MKFAFKIAGVAALLVGVALAIAWLGVEGWAKRALPIDRAVVAHVPRGAPVIRIADALVDAGVIDSPALFTWFVRLNRVEAALKAGEYRFLPTESAADVVDRLVAGDVLKHTVRLVEGTTVRDVLEVLSRTEALSTTLADVAPSALLRRLGLDDRHAEGLLFPDTYQFVRGTEDVAIVRRAYEQMQAELAQQWALRDVGLPYRDPYEALIMASIIEKETGLGADRDKIGGVFVRRLRRGMRLQTDPTVIYGLGEQFDGNLTRRHLRADGPYNTYKNHGLPPTPIALPGRASIRAALHPAEGTAMYFVARGDGTSQFSATLEEHEAAVRRYQIDRDGQ